MSTPQTYDWLPALPKVDWRNWAQPHKIISDPSMTIAEKRAVLTSWASEANTIPNWPSLRQLKNGQLVAIDEVEKALRRLSVKPLPRAHVEQALEAIPPRRGHWSRLARLWRGRSSDDNDDRNDPTAPAPVGPQTPPPMLEGALTAAA